MEDLRLERAERDRPAITSARNDGPPATTRPTISALELLNEFMGAENTFWSWKRQFELVRATYQLDNNMRILIGMKLKWRTLQ